MSLRRKSSATMVARLVAVSAFALAVVLLLVIGAAHRSPASALSGSVATPIPPEPFRVVEQSRSTAEEPSVIAFDGATVGVVGVAPYANRRGALVGTIYYTAPDAPPTRAITDFFVMRFLADGPLDPTFGKSGYVATDAGNECREVANGTVLGSDGKLTVVGQRDNGALFHRDQSDNCREQTPMVPHSYSVMLARYNDDGSLDGAFGDHGIVVDDLGRDFSAALSAQLLGDGSLAVLVVMYDGPTTETLALVKYTAQGQRDLTFGRDGIAPLNVARTVAPRALVAQPDGSVVVAAVSRKPALTGDARGSRRVVLLRVAPNGTVDGSFGTAGASGLPVADSADVGLGGMTVDARGRLLVVAEQLTKTLVWRLLENGTLDPTFGAAGMAALAINPGRALPAPVFRDIVEDTAGRLLIAGMRLDLEGGTKVARLDATGQLDQSFGTGGILSVEVAGVDQPTIHAMAAHPDGGVVVAGDGWSQDRSLGGALFVARVGR